MHSLSEEDLAHALAHTRDLWDAARGKRIFITGATGFYGHWLVETFAYANRVLALDACLVALRLPGEPKGAAERLAALPGVRFVEGDIRTLRAEDLAPARRAGEDGSIDYAIHAAIHVDAATYETNPLATLESALIGSWRVLDLLRTQGAPRVLLASSGAVYGRQPPDLEALSEENRGAPDATAPGSAYAEGKRATETLGACFQRTHGLESVIARGFSFVGPHLPLDRHFAIGNFMRDALAGGPIRVLGDGTPLRSYLYAADLAIWLWTLLFRGVAGRAYNVGSDEPVSIATAAHRVAAACSPAPAVEIRGTAVLGRPPERYVPSIERARGELGLEPLVPLDEAIRRTLRWHRTRGAA